MTNFNYAAYTTNTASGWLLKTGLLILGVSIMAPPESLARVGFAWAQQNPAIAVLILAAIVGSAVYLARLRARTLEVSVSDHIIEFKVGKLVRKSQWIKLADIRNVRLNANLIEQKFGAATLHLETVGTGGVDMTLPQLNADDAESLRQRLSPRGIEPTEQSKAA